MAKYIIEFHRILSGCTEVEADDEDQAKDLAFLGRSTGVTYNDTIRTVIESVTPAFEDEEENEDEDEN